MPVADLSPDDDWLQQYLAGQAAVPGGGPATWPAYGGHPTNYGPTGGASNPLGAGAPQGAQSAPDPNASALGFSLTSNPVTSAVARGLAAINPISSANASVLHPNLSHPNLSSPMGPAGPATASPSPLLRPGAANSLPLASGNPTLQGYNEWLSMQLGNQPTGGSPANDGPAPIGNYNDLVKGPMWPTPPPPTSGAPVSVATSPRGVKRTDAAYGPYDAPGAGAPQGSPAQTPRPPDSSNRFAMIDRTNAAATAGQPGRGYQTALNLSSLFGGRQAAPAANPADVPARNAQPVSGALGPSGMSQAPWWMGPFQPNAFGPRTPDQIAGRGLKQRYG